LVREYRVRVRAKARVRIRGRVVSTGAITR